MMNDSTTISLQVPSDHRWWHSRPARRFRSNKLALLGTATIATLVLACIVGPLLLPYGILTVDIRARFAPPFSGAHILGTDPLGRDIAARLFVAGRTSLMIGFSAMLVSSFIGVVVGIVAGFFGGAIGSLLMRVVDAFLSIPSIFLLLALSAFIQPSPMMIVLIIASTSWMEIARIVEPEVRSLRERDFVAAARMLGLSNSRIMFGEILPNAMGPIVVAASLVVARAILAEAYISFLGYGVQPPLPSWGNMLNGAQQYLTSAPWLAFVPGVAITLAVASFNFIGDGLRDALDPHASAE
jgi:peptide/nickel transport system permease protein